MNIRVKDFLISDDKTLIQAERVTELLCNTYWAKDRPLETVRNTIENSLCLGVYLGGEQVGFARCVTDFSTMYWLADVVIDERFQKLGLGKALMEAVISHERLKGLQGILATRDAHGLYEQYGFKTENDRFMRRRDEPAL